MIKAITSMDSGQDLCFPNINLREGGQFSSLQHSANQFSRTFPRYLLFQAKGKSLKLIVYSYSVIVSYS